MGNTSMGKKIAGANKISPRFFFLLSLLFAGSTFCFSQSAMHINISPGISISKAAFIHPDKADSLAVQSRFAPWYNFALGLSFYNSSNWQNDFEMGYTGQGYNLQQSIETDSSSSTKTTSAVFREYFLSVNEYYALVMTQKSSCLTGLGVSLLMHGSYGFSVAVTPSVKYFFHFKNNNRLGVSLHYYFDLFPYNEFSETFNWGLQQYTFTLKQKAGFLRFGICYSFLIGNKK